MRHIRVTEAAKGKAEEDRMKFESASEKIDFERERSKLFDSPQSLINKRREVWMIVIEYSID